MKFPTKTFTNREIASTGIITTVVWLSVNMHWIGLVTGFVAGVLITWLFHKEINDNWTVKPWVKRIFKRG